MKDKFEEFLTMLTDKTQSGKAPWENLSEGQYKLQFKNHFIELAFDISLQKKPGYPIKFDVYSNDGKLILKLIQSAPDTYQTSPDRYYHRLHSLCRAVRGEYASIEDAVDMLLNGIPF